ncbi:MAG: acyl-CoA desaturase [Planctomycetaceae bacterium]
MLQLPESVGGSRLLWAYAIPIAVMHLLSLLALVPTFFSWSALLAMVLGVHLFGGFGINLCYHRLLTHRSFRVPTWLEHTFVILALCCMQDTPAKWVATHRYHHGHADERKDPHSPLAGFLWAHFGWLLVSNRTMRDVEAYRTYARDILDDPFYMKLEKRPLWMAWIYLGHAAVITLLGFLLGWAMSGEGGGGLRMAGSFFVWGVIVRTVLVWHITWSVNSLTHLFGYRNYETGENSRNNWFVALLTVGEGWHNNHHADPNCATVRHRWWEVDITGSTIKLLARMGLATEVVPPNQARRDARALPVPRA